MSVRERRRRRRIYKIAAILAAGVLLIALVLYLLYLPHTRINQVVITGTKELDTKIVRQDVELYLDEPSLVVPRDSYFVFSRDELATRLHNRYARIDTLDLRVHGFKTLEVIISEHTTEHYARIEDSLYAVSNTGILIEELDESVSAEGTMFYLNAEHFNPKLGERILKQQEFGNLLRFLDDLSKLGVESKLVQLTNPIEYLVQIPGGAKLIIDPHESYDTYREVVREILSYKEFGYDFGNTSFDRNVAYINLRYGKKVLYCYRGDTCEDNYPVLYE